MSKAAPQSLQIHPDPTDPALAQQQERFNHLVQQIALSRAALADWTERITRYQQAVEPLRRDLHAAWREWVIALDHASLLPGLKRGERQQLGELVQEAAAPLLGQGDDPEIAAVAGRHADESRNFLSTPEDADQASDADDADDADDERPENFAGDWEQQAAAAAAQRAEWAAQRRAASALKRRRQEEQEASQSVRAVYRRLASALHPDREPDAMQRERKTALMQLANRAYAEENLLGLLELQLQAEQIDAAHLASVDRRRLQHYVSVLEEQLADLQSETRRLEDDFREATGLAPGAGLQPRKADRLISSEAQRLRGTQQALRSQIRWLLDLDTLKDFLRKQRRTTAT